jgi:hypothetical protein
MIQPQVLRRELFQLTEQINQLSYKIAMQRDLPSKQLLEAKRARLEKTRIGVKQYLRVVYELQRNTCIPQPVNAQSSSQSQLCEVV